MEIFLIIVLTTIAWGFYKAFGPEKSNVQPVKDNSSKAVNNEAQGQRDTLYGGLILFAGVLLFVLCFQMCNSRPESERESTIQQSTIADNGTKSLTYNKSILESYPFQLRFNPAQKAEENHCFIRGYSQNDKVSAIIHYDPSDNQIRNIDFQISGLSLSPNKSDFQILLDFTNKYDPNFSVYFERNSRGIFIDENEFIDEGKFVNREKQIAFELGGDVAYNNMAIKENPEERNRVLEAGNFLSVNVWNLAKPSGAVDIINSGPTVER